MSKCSIETCKVEVFKTYDKCILHCKKDKSFSKLYKDDFSDVFYDQLVKYIILDAFRGQPETELLTKNNFRNYLINDHHIAKRNKEVIVFNHIYFPNTKHEGKKKYENVLRKLENIHFNYCEFSGNRINLKNVNIYFQDCKFHSNWYIDLEANVLDNVDNVMYQFCEFNGQAFCHPIIEKDIKRLDYSLFNNCSFINDLEIRDLTINKPIFNNKDKVKKKINRIIIENCEILEDFILSNHIIDSITIKDSIFKSKLDFKNNEVKEVELNNSSFELPVDMFNGKFRNLNIFRCNFNGFVKFEKSIFGVKLEKGNVVSFKYTTFHRLVNLRNTIFYNGIDIEDADFIEPPNFLNIQTETDNTNRDTYRMIKNSFDKIGNHIEANKFYVKEMEKYTEELQKKKFSQEKFIFLLNKKVSNFGQSYARPIGGIILFSIIYRVLIWLQNIGFVYTIYKPANNIINLVASLFNSFAKGILSFTKILRPGMEFISLIFYIIFAILIWQIIIAVKRHTKR